VNRLKKNWPLLVLLIVTATVYLKSVASGFVNLDDPLLITTNPWVLKPALGNIGYVFTHYDPELYIPLTFLSYQLEVWTLGTSAVHFHLINLLMHLASVTLVFSIIQAVSKNRTVSLAAALLFAIHPINSEAVLWISSRKDLMSSLLALASIRAFMVYRKNAKSLPYTASLIFFLLALLSKISIVVLPLLLLLIDWQTGRPLKKKSLKETAPFFLLSAIFGLIAVFGKTHIIGQENPALLLLSAVRSTVFYLKLMVLPAGQTAVHILHDPGSIPAFLAAVFIVILICVLAWKTRKRFPPLAFGWAFFIISLAPTFIHYSRGNDVVFLASERYVYLASVGIFYAVAALCQALWNRHVKSSSARTILSIGLAGLIVIYGILLNKRVYAFSGSVPFNLDILKNEPLDGGTYYNLGLGYEEIGKLSEAETAYRTALLFKPKANVAINLGILLIKEGRTDEGLKMLKRATQIQPDYQGGYFNLGVAYQRLGRYDDAINAYRKTIELFPDYPEVHRNLAVVYGQKKMYREALAEFKILSEIDPGFRENVKAAVPEFFK